MQSNRVLGFVVLLFLAIGAIVVWRVAFADGDPKLQATAGSASHAGASVAGVESSAVGAAPSLSETGAMNATAEREAVTLPGNALGSGALGSGPAIRGQIVGADGQPIANAEVFGLGGVAFTPDFDDPDAFAGDIFDAKAMTQRMRDQVSQRVVVRSDEEGRFRLQVVGTSKNISLRVLAPAYRVLDRTVPRPSDSDIDLGVVTLQAGAVVAGRVLDPRGNAIVGARVSRMLEIEKAMPVGMDMAPPGTETMEDLRSGETSVTDADGRFELAHVEAGDFTLRARHPDHPTAKQDGLSVALGQVLRDVVLTMPRGAEIRGKVVGAPETVKSLQVLASVRPDANGGDAAAGLMGMMGDPADFLSEIGMAFGERTVTVDGDGAFVLRGLKADSTYRVWLAQEGRGFAGTGICSQRLEVASGTFGVELRYDAGVTVTFTVVDAASGQAIERLWVRDQLRGGGGFADMMAMAPSNARSKSYPDGKVTVANLRPKKAQTLQLTIDAIGHAQEKREGIVLPSSGNLDLGVFRLEPKPVLQVTVVAAADGRPIAKARVRLAAKGDGGGRNEVGPFAQFGRAARGGSPRSAETDGAGHCTLNALDGVVGELEVDSRGFAPLLVEVPVSTGSESEQRVQMLNGGSVEVTVAGPDHSPKAGVSIEHRSPTGGLDRRPTDAAGLARFERLAPGSHGFRLTEDLGPMGFAFAAARRGAGGEKEEVAWQNVDVQDDAVAKLALEKSPTAKLRGIVRENGVPLAGARVAFSEGEAEAGPGAFVEGVMSEAMGSMGGGSKRLAKSGDDGAYEFPELPPGEHRLRITHKDRAMTTNAPITLREGDNRFDVDLDMTTLRGFVKDPEGNPVDGARVSVRRSKKAGGDEEGAAAEDMMRSMIPGLGGPTLKTDSSGAFELRGVDPDVPLAIQATAKGYAPASVEATVARGQTNAGLELRLGTAGRIKVSVAESSGFEGVNATYVGETPSPIPPVVQMLRKGKATLDGLRPGTWEIEYRGMARPEAEAQKRRVEVVAGETVTVDF